jgi:methyltransferase (TIGR00027 family)
VKEGKPSETAMRVAAGIVGARYDQGLAALVRHRDEPYLEWFVNEHSEGARRYLAAWTSGERSPIMNLLREQMAQGAALFALLRKLFVEDEAVAAVASGIRQLVVLGAGYDPLALRLCLAHPDLRAFEIDHPATQEVKRRALSLHATEPPGLTFVPVDFSTQTAEGRLRETGGFDPKRPSFFVCEGTLMYLTPEEAASVFALVRRLSPKGSRFVFTWVDSGLLANDPKAASLGKVLKATGEPLQSSYDPGAIGPFLEEHGLRLTGAGDAHALRARYLAPLGIERPLSSLEFAALAERA